MKSRQKISLAIPAFLMAMVGDYLIGYEPWDVEPLGLIADTGWLTIADWRIALSNLLGAIAVPLYFVAAREFLRLLNAQNPKGKDKGKDRFLWLFRVGNYAGFFAFMFIHIACGLLILQFNAAYDIIGNADTAMALDLRIFWAEAVPFLVYFVVADLFTTIGWIGLVIKKVIPFSKAWLLAAPLVMALIGQIFSAFQIGFKGIDSGFESLGWLLMFAAAVKYARALEKEPVKNKQELYETKITDLRWIAYDIPGNIGWIAYFAGMILCFVKKPDFMQYWEMKSIVILSVIPAALMLTGIVELISERIHKLDRVLPKKRLLRGFGALALGGMTGMPVALCGILYGVFIADAADIAYLIVMFGGALLCAVFAGLLYKGYRRA